MRTTHKTLLSGAALAAFLPAMALAQEATTEGTTTQQVPVEIIETDDATVATTTATDPAATGTEMAQDTTTMGVTDVATTSAEPMDLSTWNYDELYANGISISQILNSDVYGPDGEDVGDVDNVLFDMDGQLLSIVARMNDGFLGIGRSHVNIPWDMVSAENWVDGLVIPFTADEVDSYVVDEANLTGTTMAGTQADGTMAGTQADGTIVGSEQVAEVDGGAFQEVQTGPNVWRATDLINNTARLREGDAFANYGVVNDLVVQDGRIAAVLVAPDAGWGGTAGTAADGTTATGGLYGYPYSGMGGWDRGAGMGTGMAADGTMATDGTVATDAGMGASGTYDLPYDATQAQMVQPFDPAMLMD